MRAAILLAFSLMAAVTSAPALDLDTVLCACSDGATSDGDRQACLAILTQRLVENGTMTRSERARLLRRPPPPVPPPAGGCVRSEPRSLEPLAHGFGVECDSAFYGVGGTAQAELRLWNQTPDAATIDFSQVDERGCWWDFWVRDEAGQVVHRQDGACGDALETIVIAPGETWTRAAAVPLVTLNAESGVPDGLSLPPGVYWLEGAIIGVSTPSYTHALGRLPIRVE